MGSTLVKPGRKIAARLLLLEVSVVLITAIIMMVVVNVTWGISALIGGGIFVIANAAFACCVFLFGGARSAKYVVASFFSGEALKILLTVTLFCIAFLYAKVEISPLLQAYLLVLGVNFLAPVLFINGNK